MFWHTFSCKNSSSSMFWHILETMENHVLDISTIQIYHLEDELAAGTQVAQVATYCRLAPGVSPALSTKSWATCWHPTHTTPSLLFTSKDTNQAWQSTENYDTTSRFVPIFTKKNNAATMPGHFFCFDLCSQSKLRTLTVTKRFAVCKRSRIMRVDSLRVWAKTRRIAANVSRTVSRLQSDSPKSPAIIQNCCSNMTQIGTQMCRLYFDSYPF